MGICKVCHTEQPEVFEENPICWSCGMDFLFKKVFIQNSSSEQKQTIKNTPSKIEVDLNF